MRILVGCDARRCGSARVPDIFENTVAEGFVANGDSDLIPADSADIEEPRMRWHRRRGLAMELFVEQYYETMTSE